MIPSDDFFPTNLIDDLNPEEAPPPSPLAEISDPSPSRGRPSEALPLFFDLETIPDKSRFHLFDRVGYTKYPERSPSSLCPPPVTVLKNTVNDIESILLELRPDAEFLAQLMRFEQACDKPRKSAAECILKCMKRLDEQDAEFDNYIKTLSVTPEYCSICAMGWAVGDGTVYSMVVGTDGDSEADILRNFWRLAAIHSPIVGFNHHSFDLLVIAIRSAVLGVNGTFRIDTRPWAGQSIDLFQARWGYRMPSSKDAAKLKDAAKVFGFDVPAGDMDGAAVYATFLESPEKIHAYVQSDVKLTRDLFNFYRHILV